MIAERPSLDSSKTTMWISTWQNKWITPFSISRNETKKEKGKLNSNNSKLCSRRCKNSRKLNKLTLKGRQPRISSRYKSPTKISLMLRNERILSFQRKREARMKRCLRREQLLLRFSKRVHSLKMSNHRDPARTETLKGVVTKINNLPQRWDLLHPGLMRAQKLLIKKWDRLMFRNH